MKKTFCFCRLKENITEYVFSSRCKTMNSQLTWSVVFILIFILPLAQPASIQELDSKTSQSWPKKGCHRVGHLRTIAIKDCETVEVALNACRGNCPSYAIPALDSSSKTTSYSLCCRMTKHEEVAFLVNCANGVRELKFPSALECKCFDCAHHV